MACLVGIYKITNIVNGKCYVGHSHRPFKRMEDHLNNLNKGVHHSKHLLRSWKNNGQSNFKFEIIEWCDEDIKLVREQYWIDSSNSKFNIAKVAGSRQGVKLSMKTRKQMSRSRKGRIVSKETRNKISMSLKGRPRTDETKEKLSKALTGRKITKEQLEQCRRASELARIANLGAKRSAESKARMSVAAYNRWRNK